MEVHLLTTWSGPLDMDSDFSNSQPEDSQPLETRQLDDHQLEPQTNVSEATVSQATAQEHDEALLDDPKSVELSAEYVGRWSSLISTTNWEKGRIIHEWREALMGSESPASAYSDEAWCRRVGGVTAQHVGRLRRVYDRFSSVYETFQGVYWSHFLAALDWDDAEMWLEGAAQSRWSVTQMRRTRWETTGGDPTQEPVDEIVSASDDEDFTPLAEVDDEAGVQDGARSVAEGPRPDGPDFGEEDESGASNLQESDDDDDLPWEGNPDSQESPFAKLPSLPVDIAEAVEQFKLGIIRHRADSWAEVDQADVIKALDALKAFASL